MVPILRMESWQGYVNFGRRVCCLGVERGRQYERGGLGTLGRLLLWLNPIGIALPCGFFSYHIYVRAEEQSTVATLPGETIEAQEGVTRRAQEKIPDKISLQGSAGV